MTPQHLGLFAAFWIAVLLFRRNQPTRGEAVRFVGGMTLGASLAHLGWALFYPDQIREHPMALFDPGVGYSVLFLPLGILATAPWAATRPVRDRYLASSLGTLPLALAAARVGCLVGGCCGGTTCPLPGIDHYPTQAIEIVGFVALHFVLVHATAATAPAMLLAGFGLIRLVVQPLRVVPPMGPEAFSPTLIAAGWFITGVVWLWQGQRRHDHAWTK